MPVSTTDVVTNAINSSETPKNATIVVSCQNTGEYKTINSTYETSISYVNIESKLTNRFDDISYYTLGNSTIVGG